ncbi:hypothetical protein KIV66_gp75 [Mycobacterium phage MyraDee]|uniref:Uncharacterized protein n=1 Tax=Mycobacterium phage MyraDee TaxID=2024303 RepID=A0A222YY03_9CAUD|nr:hypothetical protein KIV66_gp75 [Mycobacterium phage MyraDee]ASR77182.1 hypothetical protein SEA_MYRADEE_75 [Mycobacterium phage MyraDee]
MTIGDIAQLQAALEGWDEVAGYRDSYIAENADEDGEPPETSRYWEGIADYESDLAYQGELLADAIRKVLG